MSILSDSVNPDAIKEFKILSECEGESHLTKIALVDGRKVYPILSDSDINTIIKSIAAKHVDSIETFDHFEPHEPTRSFAEILNPFFPVQPTLENGLLTSPSQSALTLSDEEANYLISNGHEEIFEIAQEIKEKQEKLFEILHLSVRLGFVDMESWNQFNEESYQLQGLYSRIHQHYSDYIIVEQKEALIKEKILTSADIRALNKLRIKFIKSLPLFERPPQRAYSDELNCLLNNETGSIKVSNEIFLDIVREVSELMKRDIEASFDTSSGDKPKVDFSEKFNLFINAIIAARLAAAEESGKPFEKAVYLPFNEMLYERLEAFMPHWNHPNFPKALRLFLNSDITIDQLNSFMHAHRSDAAASRKDPIRCLFYAAYHEFNSEKSESSFWYIHLAMNYLDNQRYPEIVEHIIKHIRSIDSNPSDKSEYHQVLEKLEGLKVSKIREDKIDEDQISCPISFELMIDAVVDLDGNSYSQRAIEEWLQKHGTSPFTNKPLNIKDLKPNHYVRNLAMIRKNQRNTISVKA